MKKLIRTCLTLLGALVVALVAYGVIVFVYSQHVAIYEYRLDAWPPDTADEKPAQISSADPKRVRILAIEGGALFGLADLEVLKAIEQKAGKPIYELFDFFAGSSTGAIISTLLLHPQKESGKPLTIDQAIKSYEQFGGKMLNAPFYHKLLSGFGTLGPAFTNEARIRTTQDFVGDALFKDLLRPAMFPSYSEKERGLKVFRNWHEEEANIYLWSVVTAVTSVPSVFPAVVLKGNNEEDFFYGDPALVSNEPADLAYLHARTNLPDVEEFVVVSLGTRRDFEITRDTSVRGGLFEWFRPALHMLYRGQSNVSQSALERHARFDSDVDVSLIVLDATIPDGISSLDSDPQNMALIRRAGSDYVRTHEKQIDNLVQLLTQPAGTPESN